jgi:hypothetical protein
MTATLRRGALLLFAVVAIGVVVWNVVPPPSRTSKNLAPPTASLSYSPPATADANSLQGPRATDEREYAIALEELQGLPPDLPPGTPVELWVGWERPSAAPKLQRLIPRAELVRVIPPLTPSGPTAVVFRVPVNRIPDLLWGDGYGSLSVVVLT